MLYLINYVDLKCVLGVCFHRDSIWLAALPLLTVSTSASWYKYVKRVTSELPFMALKTNINSWQ